MAALLLLSLGGTLWLFRPNQQSDTVTVISEGKVLYTLSLHLDQTLEIVSARGTNTVTIKNGKAAVTEADCPDGHCMARGFCDGGAQIVCLPNRLVLQFSDSPTIDGIAG
jgi:hypothetical protein